MATIESVTGQRSEDVPPDPAALIESMRAFGYALPAAVADLVDNSITAGASQIDIDIHWAGENSHVLVVDDGGGMDGATLTNAMRLGSRSPVETRDPNDLGRFGLGLKAAAFSQGRSLTVASRAAGEGVEVRRWDLDHVTETGTWSLLMDPPPTAAVALDAVQDSPTGTAVLIEQLDRMTDGAVAGDIDAQSRFLHQARAVENHLAMVFHGFLQDGLRISIHGTAVRPWDPFLANHTATQKLPPDRHPFEGGTVVVQPYVLPFHTKLTREEHGVLGGVKGWNAHQGFYVYRAGRLIVAGDWLDLGFKQEEHYKLARIRVDLENSMDLAWQIDVRKARARVPGPLRDHLRRAADVCRRQAVEAYSFRGKNRSRTTTVGNSYVWQRRHERDRSVRYVVNRAHPVVAQALEQAGDGRRALDAALRVVEESLPVVAIMKDASEHPDELTAQGPYHGRPGEVAALLKIAYERLLEQGVPPNRALEHLTGTEPFSLYPGVVESFAEERGR